MGAINAEFLCELYVKYAAELREVRDSQRDFRTAKSAGDFEAQLDDVEAELTYLQLRERAPKVVVEIGTFHGWSTTWILQALRKNGAGHLYSYDIVDNVVRNVPDELREGRWTFTKGDVRRQLATMPTEVDYLFIDAAHSASFANWYIRELFPRVPGGIRVSVHDVYHSRFAVPLSEGAVIMRWIKKNDVPYFTASPAKDPASFGRILEVKRELGLLEPVHDGKDNPMIFFDLPAR